MKFPDFKITVPLPDSIKDRIFGDHPSAPESETPSAPELAGANDELKKINADIRDKDGRDVKTWKDVF